MQLQPYDQLAAVYSAAGQDRPARRVLHAKLRRESRAGTWIHQIWGLIQDAAISYGYHPGRAAAVFAILLIAGTAYYNLAADCGGTRGLCPISSIQHPTWDPFL